MNDSLSDPLIERAKKIEHMLSECEDWPQRMNQWEQDFIADMRDKFEKYGSLTDGQVDKIEKIYCEKVP